MKELFKWPTTLPTSPPFRSSHSFTQAFHVSFCVCLLDLHVCHWSGVLMMFMKLLAAVELNRVELNESTIGVETLQCLWSSKDVCVENTVNYIKIQPKVSPTGTTPNSGSTIVPILLTSPLSSDSSPSVKTRIHVKVRFSQVLVKILVF
jgi:hypothetical protein